MRVKIDETSTTLKATNKEFDKLMDLLFYLGSDLPEEYKEVINSLTDAMNEASYEASQSI